MNRRHRDFQPRGERPQLIGFVSQCDPLGRNAFVEQIFSVRPGVHEPHDRRERDDNCPNAGDGCIFSPIDDSCDCAGIP